jgi:hypothetical protein
MQLLLVLLRSECQVFMTLAIHFIYATPMAEDDPNQAIYLVVLDSGSQRPRLCDNLIVR